MATGGVFTKGTDVTAAQYNEGTPAELPNRLFCTEIVPPVAVATGELPKATMVLDRTVAVPFAWELMPKEPEIVLDSTSTSA